MTKQEEYEILKYINYQDTDYKAASENMHDRTTCDCISRQRAINAVSRGCWEFRGIFAECEKNLNELPSAQPESCGDAVSRNSIIRALNTMDRYVSDELTLCDTDRKFPKNEVFIVDDVYEEIAENLPSVQPDRCADCRFTFYAKSTEDNT